ncbi:nuclear transport factor 2 family protein [Sphingobacterium griseoflavum]|uniref:SnoaL-like domain-containing protein n=1 Tax=Sphingobacterium griseoflavum TaxID=1474952 RepID=A0ABQ3HVI6_9SPHI|nr:nuclear transport factor 2 family protein [Sphingobacterium griseoflavum]GHE31673.1 hypothetical protein GCM10017764_13510 [Sphingobacterium griseoflavum]
MKTSVPNYCGNSPKMQFIADFNLAYAASDIASALSFLHEDIQWEIIGEQMMHGHDAVRDFIEKNANLSVISFELQDVLSHGKLGSACGQLKLSNETIHFADFYEFSSHSAKATIKRIKTFALSSPS